MKRVIAVCLILVLGSCASTDGKKTLHMSQRQINSSGYDEDYIARVERQASQHGVVVKWVHPPKAEKAKKDGQ
ncbi:MAG: hypothetical protein ACREPB_11645 [Arenimonas sp.]